MRGKSVIRRSFLLEQIIKCFARIVTLDALRAATRGERDAVVRLEEVTEVGLDLAADVIGLRFVALIILARIEMAAVLTAVQIFIAVRAFIGARDFGDDFDLASAAMTDHKISRRQPSPFSMGGYSACLHLGQMPGLER